MVETASQDNLKINKKAEVGTDNLRHGILTRVVEKFGSTKEKIYDFFRYKQLKLKEYFGRVDKDEFTELLEYDFNGELKDNKPEDSFGVQTRAWGACRTFLEREIEFNNDVAKDKLLFWVDRFSDKYKLSQDRINTAREIVDGYFQKRAKAKELMNRYPDKRELVNHVTKLSFPEGVDFDVTLGPMSINISTDSKAFSDIYNRKHGGINIPYLGFATSTGDGADEAYYIVVNSRRVRGKRLKQEVEKHELQHIQNRLSRKIINSEIDNEYAQKLRSDFEVEDDNKLKEEKLEKWLIYQRMNALNDAKDELTAMVKGGMTERQAAKQVLIKDRGPYDYLSDTRSLVKQVKGNAKISKRILVSEYEKLIKSGMNAFRKLRRRATLSKELAIAMLADKPFDEWPNAVERLIKEQEQSDSGVLVSA